MTMHIDEGRLQAYLDRELQLDEMRPVERHLAACDGCRAGLEELRSLSVAFAVAAAGLDGAPRARQFGIGWPRQRRFGTAWAALPRAAVLLLVAGAAAAAAIPGSPIRGWLSDAAAPAPAPAAPLASPAVEAAAPAATPAMLEAGVSVEAADGVVDIVLRDAGDGLRVRAKLVEGTRAGVYAAGEASSSRFQTGAGRIEVTNARSGELRIELPRGVPTATVTVNGREYLRKQDGRLDLRVGAEESAGEVEFSVEP